MSLNVYDSYFQPGQILFLVDGYSTQEENTKLIEWAKSILPQGIEISAQASDPLQFPPPDSSKYLKRAVVAPGGIVAEKPRGPQIESKPSVFTLLPIQVSGLKKEEKPGEAEAQLFDLIMTVDRNRKYAPGKTLRAVSPNWFVTGGSSSPGSTGGPGSRPDSYDGAPDTHDFEFDLSNLPPGIRSQIENGNKGAGVDVAILDTAPLATLQEIDDVWVKTKKHSLLSRLRDPSDLRLVDIIKDNQLNTPSRLYQPDPPGFLQSNDGGHDYIMADHGLFAAGIINTLAPEATIRIFQVLNPFGVSDLTSIAQGLQKVLAQYSNQENLLVNMSLTINFPIEEAHITTENAIGKRIGMMILSQKRPAWLELLCKLYNWLCMLIAKIFGITLPPCQPSWYERQTWAMEGICDSLKVLGSKVIAAAGNRRKKGGPKPQAEYPAAFPDILGVGALPKSEPPADPNTPLETASYSNLSDRPKGSGIATLGGEAGAEKGVLGIYLTEVPGPTGMGIPPTQSGNGWAWWAGTSFATPVVTGITAAILSNKLPGGTAQEVLAELQDHPRYHTRDQEDVLFVKQCDPSSTAARHP